MGSSMAMHSRAFANTLMQSRAVANPQLRDANSTWKPMQSRAFANRPDSDPMEHKRTHSADTSAPKDEERAIPNAKVHWAHKYEDEVRRIPGRDVLLLIVYYLW